MLRLERHLDDGAVFEDRGCGRYNLLRFLLRIILHWGSVRTVQGNGRQEFLLNRHIPPLCRDQELTYVHSTRSFSKYEGMRQYVINSNAAFRRHLRDLFTHFPLYCSLLIIFEVSRISVARGSIRAKLLPRSKSWSDIVSMRLDLPVPVFPMM
jgi:hypothetical protein